MSIPSKQAETMTEAQRAANAKAERVRDALVDAGIECPEASSLPKPDKTKRDSALAGSFNRWLGRRSPEKQQEAPPSAAPAAESPKGP
jgi:hypothetical protein